jgi:hypothetical protein
MAQSPSRSITRPISRTYMAAWLVLAGAAAAYLAVLLLRPELLTVSYGPEPVSEQELNGGHRAMSQVLAEVNVLRRVVGDVQKEVYELNDSMAAQIAREKVVTSRLAALEERAAGPMVGETTALKPQPIAESRPVPKGVMVRAPSRIAGVGNDAPSAPEPQNATHVKSIASGQAIETAIETASIAPLQQPVLKSSMPADDEVPFATRLPAVQIPFGVRLATASSLEGLRLNWRSLLERHGTVLRPLSAHYLPPSADEGTYQLIAGPVATADQAKNICVTLHARDVACSLIVFGGEAM